LKLETQNKNGELEVDMPAEEAKLDAEEMRKKEKCC